MKPVLAGLAFVILPTLAPAADLKFRMQEIENTLKCGYGVVVADVNGDGKPDIVVADANRVVWYENPTWKRRTMIEGAVPPDIVCIAACDIERNGKVAFFLGADWHEDDPTKGGSVHWMRRGKTLDDPWEVFKIGEEPAVHRIGIMDGTVFVMPLVGRGASKEKNWLDGRPVRILQFWPPEDLTKSPWGPRLLDETLHLVHGFDTWDSHSAVGGPNLVVASHEGLSQIRFSRCGLDWRPKMQNIYPNRSAEKGQVPGSIEVRRGKLAEEKYFLTSIEPVRGDELVVYPIDLGGRFVVDNHLRCGHALRCADFDQGDRDWIIAGVRDDLSNNDGERRGVRIYKCINGRSDKWEPQIVDDGGIACEDLTVADLNGDGLPDIIATGRQTGNVRIYWNEGRK